MAGWMLSAVVLLVSVVAAYAAERPNIVILLADDLGYSDIGCYGGEMKTPHWGQLAAHGLRFTQFYNTARCCRTRASLLTGLYPHQAGLGHMMTDQGLDGYRGALNRNCVMIAKVLRMAGYWTYISGQWHVAKKIGPASGTDKYNWPLGRDFDRFFGTLHGAGSYYNPNTLTLGDFFYTDAIGDYAIKFIRERDCSRPFFPNVAFTAPHWPLHAWPHNSAKYDGVYEAGWDLLRRQRYERMVGMGPIKRSWRLSPPAPGGPAS